MRLRRGGVGGEIPAARLIKHRKNPFWPIGLGKCGIQSASLKEFIEYWKGLIIQKPAVAPSNKTELINN